MTHAMKMIAQICLRFPPLLALLPLLLSEGCEKQPEEANAPLYPVEFTIGFESGTRAGAGSSELTAEESTIQRVQFMVFAHRAGTTYLEKELTYGQFDGCPAAKLFQSVFVCRRIELTIG